MGAAACKKDEIEIRNLYQLYHRVSLQILPKKVADELNCIRMKLIKDKIPKECLHIYNILLNNVREESILDILKQKFQQVINDYISKPNNDKIEQHFIESFRFFNFEDLRIFWSMECYKKNNFISEFLNLFYSIDIYCQKISQFLSRLNEKYYSFFYSHLWKQYKQNIDTLSSIYNFQFINNDLFQKLPSEFTMQQLMYKIWGNNILPKINKSQISLLLHNNENQDLRQYFNHYIEIAINQQQLNYLGNIGLINSKVLNNFLELLMEVLTEQFDIGLDKNVEKIFKYVKENQFLNELLHEHILIHNVYPKVFQYIINLLALILKQQFKITKQYLTEQIVQDKIKNDTLSKLLLNENEENNTKPSNILSSQSKTNYTSSLKANYQSVQNQEETTFFNYENNKWEHFNHEETSVCQNMIDSSNKLEEEKRRVKERSIQLFQKFNSENLKQQEFTVSYINIMLNYTHKNKKEEISDLILKLSFFF